MPAFTTVLIDGNIQNAATAAIPVSDMGFIRGYGVFEVIRSFNGTCFRMQPHLERLERSATMLGIDLPDHAAIESWADTAAQGLPDGVIRVLVSAGDDPFEGTTRVVVTGEPAVPQPASLTLHPTVAPWHADGADWELLRAKTLSYANNFGAIRQARLAGHTDALLLGRSGRILEGPTFTVGWVVEEAGQVVYETPAMSLGILDSITRQVAFDAAADAGLELREVEVGLDRLDDAVEFFALSTLRDAIGATAVGEREFTVGPATEKLRAAMADLTRSELAGSR
jgi:4-amino-4-deoxychorismate lyase